MCLQVSFSAMCHSRKNPVWFFETQSCTGDIYANKEKLKSYKGVQRAENKLWCISGGYNSPLLSGVIPSLHTVSTVRNTLTQIPHMGLRYALPCHVYTRQQPSFPLFPPTSCPPFFLHLIDFSNEQNTQTHNMFMSVTEIDLISFLCHLQT